MALYTTLQDVKKILYANQKSRIRFADQSVVDVNTFTLNGTIRDMRDQTPNYDIIVDESLFLVSSAFIGEYSVVIIFDSATAFKVYEKQASKTNFKLAGSGTISADFVSPSGFYTIEIGAFSGVITAGAGVSVDLVCHVSEDTSDAFIDHAEVILDSAIQGGGAKYRDGANQKMFSPPDVPPEIKVACAYLAAYLIYTSVFAEEQRDFEVKGSVFLRHFSDAWKKKSESLVEQYIISAGRKPPVSYKAGNSDESTFFGVNLKWLEPQIGASCPCDDNPIDICGDC